MDLHHLNTNDFAYGMVFQENLTFLRSFNSNSKTHRIATLINCMESLEFKLDYDHIPKKEQISLNRFSKKYKQIHKAVSLHFKRINGKGIYEDVKKISKIGSKHFDVYFKYLAAHDAVSKIGEKRLILALSRNLIPIEYILKNKIIVGSYDKALKKYILGLPSALKLLIDIFDLNIDIFKDKELHLGDLFDKTKEINHIINSYLEFYPDPFIVKCLLMHQNNSGFIVTRETKARLYNFLEENGFDKVYAIKPENIFPGSLFDSDYEIIDLLNLDVSKRHSELIDNQTKDNLLTDFLINEYGYVDSMFSPNIHTKISDSISQSHKKQYGTYSYQNNVFIDNFEYYYSEIDAKIVGSSLNSFVKKCLNRVANNKIFSIKIIDQKRHDYWHNEHLFNEIQSICRQFNIYCDNSTVSNSWVVCDDDSVKFQNIKSCHKVKYLEFNENSYIYSINQLLFAFAGGLSYYNKIEENSFAEQVLKHRILYSLGNQSQKAMIDFLVDNDILRIDNDVVSFTDLDVIKMLYISFCYGSIPFYLLKEKHKKKAKKLLSRGLFVKNDHLLSFNEQKYFSFIFDNTYYVGPAIRNKYEHGKGAFYSQNEIDEDFALGLKGLTELLFKMLLDIFYRTKK